MLCLFSEKTEVEIPSPWLGCAEKDDLMDMVQTPVQFCAPPQTLSMTLGKSFYGVSRHELGWVERYCAFALPW